MIVESELRFRSGNSSGFFFDLLAAAAAAAALFRLLAAAIAAAGDNGVPVVAEVVRDGDGLLGDCDLLGPRWDGGDNAEDAVDGPFGPFGCEAELPIMTKKMISSNLSFHSPSKPGHKADPFIPTNFLFLTSKLREMRHRSISSSCFT